MALEYFELGLRGNHSDSLPEMVFLYISITRCETGQESRIVYSSNDTYDSMMSLVDGGLWFLLMSLTK